MKISSIVGTRGGRGGELSTVSSGITVGVFAVIIIWRKHVDTGVQCSSSFTVKNMSDLPNLTVSSFQKGLRFFIFIGSHYSHQLDLSKAETMIPDACSKCLSGGTSELQRAVGSKGFDLLRYAGGGRCHDFLDPFVRRATTCIRWQRELKVSSLERFSW